MKVCFYSCHDYEIPFLERHSPRGFKSKYIKAPLRMSSVDEAQGCEVVSVFSRDDVSTKIIQELSKLGVKCIATRSTGYNHIDLKAAAKFDMRVANVPNYSPHAIAEHAILLMLALNRKLIAAQEGMKKNNFSLKGLLGRNLGDLRIGIIGTGRIGQATIQMLNGFGSKVYAYDLYPEKHLYKTLDFQYTDLDTLLSDSDIISLHVPLNLGTRYIIDMDQIQKMKPGVMIINTSRGKLIRTEAVLKALKDGHIAALGIDVYENEHDIFFEDHSGEEIHDPLFQELRTLDNVLITGHQAFFTETALDNIAQTTFDNISTYSRGATSANFLC